MSHLSASVSKSVVFVPNAPHRCIWLLSLPAQVYNAFVFCPLITDVLRALEHLSPPHPLRHPLLASLIASVYGIPCVGRARGVRVSPSSGRCDFSPITACGFDSWAQQVFLKPSTIPVGMCDIVPFFFIFFKYIPY